MQFPRVSMIRALEISLKNGYERCFGKYMTVPNLDEFHVYKSASARHGTDGFEGGSMTKKYDRVNCICNI